MIWGRSNASFKQATLRDDRQDVAYAQGAISVEQVTHSFAKSILAISKTSLQIAPHEFVSIVGSEWLRKDDFAKPDGWLVALSEMVKSYSAPRHPEQVGAMSHTCWRAILFTLAYRDRERGIRRSHARCQ